MTDTQEVMNLIKQYLENNTVPNGFLDNVVDYVLPIFSMLVVIIGGIWTVYTYIKGKNREIDEKVLSEVYAPMFQFFVKSDSLANLKECVIDYKNDALHDWEKNITRMQKNKNGVTISCQIIAIPNFSKEDFLNMFSEVNIGLAPRELVVLFSIYRATVYMEKNETSYEKRERAVAYGKDIEYAIRKHAYVGYMTYCNKLGISGYKTDDLYEIKGDCIELKLPCLDDFKIKRKNAIPAVFGKKMKD